MFFKGPCLQESNIYLSSMFLYSGYSEGISCPKFPCLSWFCKYGYLKNFTPFLSLALFPFSALLPGQGWCVRKLVDGKKSPRSGGWNFLLPREAEPFCKNKLHCVCFFLYSPTDINKCLLLSDTVPGCRGTRQTKAIGFCA